MNILPLYRLRLADAIKAGDTTPMMVFPIGEWHSAKYPDLPLTEDLANELIANFEANVLGTEPVVDSSGKHDTSAPAAGWVKRVYLASYEEGKVTGLALWADVKWTELGAGLLTDEQYKYGSVEIGPVVLNDSGEEVENVLRSLTLTNTPVLRLMPGVKDAAAKQRTAVTLSLSEFTLADEADPLDELLSDMESLAGKIDEQLGGKPGVKRARVYVSDLRASIKAHKKALAEPDSTNARRDALERACQEAFGAAGDGVYVEDFGDDWCIYHVWRDGEGAYYKTPYVADDHGFTFGQPAEQKKETNWVPVSDGASGAAYPSSSQAVAAGKAGEGTGAALAEEPAAQKGAEQHMKTVAQKLNLDENASEADILARVVELSEHDAAETARANTAETKLAEVETKAKVDAFAVKLDEKINGGFIAPGERETFVNLAEKDAALAESLIGTRTSKVIALGEIGSGAEGGSEEYENASVELAEKSKARASKDGTTYAAAEKLVLAEDTDLAERYSAWRLNPRKEA